MFLWALRVSRAEWCISSIQKLARQWAKTANRAPELDANQGPSAESA